MASQGQLNVPKVELEIISISGISLILHLDQDYYMSNGPISQTAGAKVVIDEPNTIARPDENGIDLQPNTASSISVKKVDISQDIIVHPN